MTEIKLIVGEFALIGTANATTGYIIDGDDVQERADKQHNKYFGETCHIFERGIVGAGLCYEGEDTTICGVLYKNEASAKAALKEMIARRNNELLGAMK